MHKDGQPTYLIEMTRDALSDEVVSVMLLAVQKDNLGPNIEQALKRCVLMCSKTVTRMGGA
jgi:hypothetical protein